MYLQCKLNKVFQSMYKNFICLEKENCSKSHQPHAIALLFPQAIHLEE